MRRSPSPAFFSSPAATLLLGALLSAGCPPALPSPDSCDRGSTSGVTDLQIGKQPAPEDQPNVFTPYHDGDFALLAYGGQGFTMLPVRLLVSGPAPPACLAQQTRICAGVCAAGTGGSSNVALNTYASDGGRATAPLYVVLGGRNEEELFHSLTVTTTVGSVTRTVQLGLPPPLAERDGAADGSHD